MKGALWSWLLVLAGCGTSPVQQCREGVGTTCEKVFECYTTDTERAAIKPIYGKDVPACVAQLSATLKCDTADKDACPAGLVYHGDQAAACVRETKALKCEQLKAGMTPASCTMICK